MVFENVLRPLVVVTVELAVSVACCDFEVFMVQVNGIYLFCELGERCSGS